jgi:hypothetical protein
MPGRGGAELLDDPLNFVVAPFAEVMEADRAVGVGDVHSGPVSVREGAPDRVIAVDRDGIASSRLVDPDMWEGTGKLIGGTVRHRNGHERLLTLTNRPPHRCAAAGRSRPWKRLVYALGSMRIRLGLSSGQSSLRGWLMSQGDPRV